MNSKTKAQGGFRAVWTAVFMFVKNLPAKIGELFEPEEVEVTFKGTGRNITYTYTKVEHKQTA